MRFVGGLFCLSAFLEPSLFNMADLRADVKGFVVGFFALHIPGGRRKRHNFDEPVCTVLVGVCLGDDLGERACRLRWVVCTVLAGVCFGDDLGELAVDFGFWWPRAADFRGVCGGAFCFSTFLGLFLLLLREKKSFWV